MPLGAKQFVGKMSAKMEDIMLGFGVLWGTGILPTGVQAPSPEIVPAPIPAPLRPPLDVTATTSKSSYLLGEDVKIEFTFNNVSSSAVQMQPFPPLVKIYRPRLEEVVRTFSAGTETKSLEPEEVASFTVTWD